MNISFLNSENYFRIATLVNQDVYKSQGAFKFKHVEEENGDKYVLLNSNCANSTIYIYHISGFISKILIFGQNCESPKPIDDCTLKTLNDYFALILSEYLITQYHIGNTISLDLKDQAPSMYLSVIEKVEMELKLSKEIFNETFQFNFSESSSRHMISETINTLCAVFNSESKVQAHVSGLSYSKALNLIEDLKKADIESWITAGGIAILISKDEIKQHEDLFKKYETMPCLGSTRHVENVMMK